MIIKAVYPYTQPGHRNKTTLNLHKYDFASPLSLLAFSKIHLSGKVVASLQELPQRPTKSSMESVSGLYPKILWTPLLKIFPLLLPQILDCWYHDPYPILIRFPHWKILCLKPNIHFSVNADLSFLSRNTTTTLRSRVLPYWGKQ